MFENIIGQSAVQSIIHDIKNNSLPPSVLFYGPEAQGKGTAALELSRVLSCEKNAEWGCSCGSCAQHKNLSHPDLLVLGPRPFQAEIAACRSVFMNDTENFASRMLFLRAIRKLLLRFSPVLRESESGISKLNGYISIVIDCCEELFSRQSKTENAVKLCDKICDACLKLETEGCGAVISAPHIRRGAYWLRMSPNGKIKMLLIENAEKMNDAARNSLLKILEEPPPFAQIVLTSQRPKALLPTILSRLRPYNFARRGAKDEEAVLNRVFRTEIPAAEKNAKERNRAENPIVVFQNSFLPASRESLAPAAAYFLSSLAARAVQLARKREARAPAEALLLIGRHCAPLAGTGAFNRHDTEIKLMAQAVLKAGENFSSKPLFNVFLSLLYETAGAALLSYSGPGAQACRSALKKHAEEAGAAVEIYNQQPSVAIERLAFELAAEFSMIDGTLS